MDVERTIEFILEHQAKAEEHMAQWEIRQAKWEERQAKWEERQAKVEARQDKADKQIATIRTILKTGMKLMVKLEQGQKRADARLDELAVAHAATEKSLKAFIEPMRRGGNRSN